MTNKPKSVTYFRSEFGAFEKERTNPFYKFQLKEYDPSGRLIMEHEFKTNGAKELETSYKYDGGQNLVEKKTVYPLEDTIEKLM